MASDRGATTTDAADLDSQANALDNAIAAFQAGAEGSLPNMAWRRPEPVGWIAVDGR